MNIAIAFLTNYPEQSTLDFAKEVAIYTKYDVYIIADSMKHIERNDYYTSIQIQDDDCKINGYINSSFTETTTRIRKNPIAYDKFLCAFCNIFTGYGFVWVVEEDVFMRTPDILKTLSDKYSSYDLVTANNFRKSDTLQDWHWKYIFKAIQPPYYYSMVCAAGVSRRLLNAVKEYVDKNKSLFFVEALFNTLAMQNGLNCIAPLEMKTLMWMADWKLDDYLLLPNNLFHPVKNLNDHDVLRKSIAKAQYFNYKPINTLPNFITDLL